MHLDPLFFFYLTVLFYLVAWAGCTAFIRLPPNAPASAVWNKVCAIAALVAGLIAIILLTVRGS
jgi:hypothetical protein